MVSKLTWVPSSSSEAWQFEGQQEYTANGGFSIGCRIVLGDHTVHEGEDVFDVKEYSAGKFEMDIVDKVTWTKESPFYWMGNWHGEDTRRGFTSLSTRLTRACSSSPRLR